MFSKIVTNCQKATLFLQVIDTLPVGLHLVSFHRKSMGFVSSFDKRNILLFSSKSILY